jgi:hypothetical protein
MIPGFKYVTRGLNPIHPLNRGLIRHWASEKIDDPYAGSGTGTIWSTRNPLRKWNLGFNGSAAWYPALDLQGQRRSVYIDGVDDYLNAGTVPVTAVPFSIAFWHKNWAASSSVTWWLGEGGAGQWRAFYGGGSTTSLSCLSVQNNDFKTASTTVGYTQSKWYLYTAVFASATSRTCYINGGSSGTNTASSTPTGINEFYIGCGRANAARDNFTSGNYADIRIWDRALNDGEVSQLYHDSVRIFNRMNNYRTYLFLNQYTAPSSTVRKTWRALQLAR